MRRLVIAIAMTIVGAVAWGSAAQAQTTSTATFTSPSTAASGAPIWIRSVTPCPAAQGGEVMVAEAFAGLQDNPTTAAGTSVLGDVRPDGHWRLTLAAPAGTPKGAEASYYLQVVCRAFNTSGPSTTTTSTTTTTAPGGTATPSQVTTAPTPPTPPTSRVALTYAVRPLRVTGGLGTAATPAPSSPTSPVASSGTANTPAASPVGGSTSTAAASTAARAASSGFFSERSFTAAAAPSGVITTPGFDDEALAAQVREDLANARRRSPIASGSTPLPSLDVAPVVASAPAPATPDSGNAAVLVLVALVVGLGAGGWQVRRHARST